MNNKKNRYFQQGGSPIDDPKNIFELIFGSLVGNQQPSYGLGDQNYNNEEDYLRAYYEKEANDELYSGKYDVIPENARKKIAAKYVNKKLEEGKDAPGVKTNLNEGIFQGINNYLGSNEFQTGFQGIIDQFQEYQKNKDNQQESVDHDPYTVGEDRGFGSYYQMGGSVPLSFLSEQTGINSNNLGMFANASMNYKDNKFTAGELRSAAENAKRIYKYNKKKAPKEYNDIISGKIKSADELTPELRSELFFSSLTKVEPVKTKNNKIKGYEIKAKGGLTSFNYDSPMGLARAYDHLYGKGDGDNVPKFLRKLKESNLFPEQDFSPLIQMASLEEGEYFFDSKGRKIYKDRISTEGYKKILLIKINLL